MRKMKERVVAVIMMFLMLLTAILPSDAAWATTASGTAATVKYQTVHDPSIVVGYVKENVTSITSATDIKGEKDNTYSKEVYFIFGSHMAWAYTWDLMNWTSFTNNINTSYSTLFAKEFAWAKLGDSVYSPKDNMWAPDVIWNQKMGKWCMYMSINGCSWNSCICMLTADSLMGNWTYAGPVVYSGFTAAGTVRDFSKTDYTKATGETSLNSRYITSSYVCQDNKVNCTATTWNRSYGAHAIDPCVSYDEEGNLYMTYGSWSGGIYMLELDESTGLRDYNTAYTYQSGKSDPYMGYMLGGGGQKSGEASYIQKIGDYYYLFITYGALVANGGYNMRVFRSADIKGPYVDENGKAATAVGTDYQSNVGTRLMSYYKWSYMKYGYTAQGHNSAFVDDDGRAYVVYHTRTNDGTEGHQVRVHQLFTTENGWLVAAPFEYTGEKLASVNTTDIKGVYEVLFQESTDFSNLECNTSKTLRFLEDGTVLGDAEGTWNWSSTKGAPYVDVVLDGSAYEGVFVEQNMEAATAAAAYINRTYNVGDKVICFSLIEKANDQTAVWGYLNQGSEQELLDQAASRLTLPAAAIGNMELPKSSVGASVTWKSGNPAVLSDEGVIGDITEDTTVTMTATLSMDTLSVTKEFQVLVYAPQQVGKSKVLASYFTDQAVDLTGVTQGKYQFANPFLDDNISGLNAVNGISVKFQLQSSGNTDFLSNILAFNSGNKGGLYFTGGSYLGFNASSNIYPGYYDANVDNTNWVAGKDFLGKSANVEIRILPTGAEVYVNGIKAYDLADVSNGTVSGSVNVSDASTALKYVLESAEYLNFGWGSWWDNGYQGKISNVVLSVLPVEEEEAEDPVESSYDYYENYSAKKNTTAAGTGFTSPNASGDLKVLYNKDDYGYYLSYQNTSTSGNRGAYMYFPQENQYSGSYALELDFKIASGPDRDTELAILGTDAAWSSNNINNGVGSGYILKLTAGANSTDVSVAGTTETLTIPKDTWTHLTVNVSEDGTVTARIGDDLITAKADGTNTLKGLFLCPGRNGGTVCLDNIAVSQALVCMHGEEQQELVEEVSASCTAKGYRIYTCKTCGLSKTVILPATGHNYEIITEAATYTKAGTVTHKCTEGDSSYQEEIPMLLVDTTVLNQVSVGQKGLTVTWNKVTDATGYTIYRKTASGEAWKEIATVSSGASSYLDTDVASGKKYYYTVGAYVTEGNEKAAGAYNQTGLSATFVAAPTISGLTNVYGGVQIDWTAVTGAAKYRVYRKSGSGSWARIGETTGTSFTDKTVKGGTAYTYTIRCINAAGTAFTSAYDTVGKSVKYIAAPTLSSVTNVYGGVQVKWAASAGAVKYRVYRKSGSGSWVKIGETTGTSYTDKTAKSGTTYTYTVRCINSAGTVFTSGHTSGKSVKYIAAPTISGATSVYGGVQINWGKVTGAVKYRVYRKSGSGSWVRIGETTGTSYTDKTAKGGTTYTYTVRCISSDGKSFTSGYNTTGKSVKYIAAPVISSVTSVYGGVQVKWGKAAGAVKYRVYRRSGSGSWVKIGETTGTSYTDKTAKSGTTYVYTVRCINSAGTAFTSGHTAGKSVKYIAAPGLPSLANTSSGVQIKWSKVTGAVKYRVYRKSGNGSWTKVGDTTGTSFIDKTAKKGTAYTYTIRCISSDGKSFTSGYHATGKKIVRK